VDRMAFAPDPSALRRSFVNAMRLPVYSPKALERAPSATTA
jgi:hypothetical protein